MQTLIVGRDITGVRGILMTNLAHNLLDARRAARRPSGHQARRPRAHLRRAARRRRSGWRPCCRRRASSRATASGCRLANVPAYPIAFYGALIAGATVVPMNPLLKGREVEYYVEGLRREGDRRRRADGRRRRGSRRSPAGSRRSSSARRARTTCPTSAPNSSSATTTTPPSSSTPPAPPGSPRAPSSRTTTCTPTPHERRDARRDPPDDVIMGCLPLFHVFGLTCGLNAVGAGRLVPDADPALRRRQGARGHRPRQGDRLRGRPDDVRRRCCTTTTAGTPTSRRCGSASPAARPCRSR